MAALAGRLLAGCAVERQPAGQMESVCWRCLKAGDVIVGRLFRSFGVAETIPITCGRCGQRVAFRDDGNLDRTETQIAR